MSTNPAVTIPELADFGRDREDLLTALRANDLPSTEVAIATLFAHEIEANIVELLTRAAGEDLDLPSKRLLFRGLHILGGRRLPSGYRPLIALLHGSPERAEALLGDAITETLSKILAGVFDGDPEPLLGLISDITLDEFVRDAALNAFTFLVFDGRIERSFADDYLRRFEPECTAPAGDMIWHAWMTAVALLGFEHLTDRVHAAFADGRIPRNVAEKKHYRELLEAALARPNDGKRFADEHLGYIEDVLAELEPWSRGHPGEDDDIATDDDIAEWALKGLSWLPRGTPVRNPWAGVGRNDPCPCGSGKKFKRCCLP
jgi:hypothetical protein